MAEPTDDELSDIPKTKKELQELAELASKVKSETDAAVQAIKSQDAETVAALINYANIQTDTYQKRAKEFRKLADEYKSIDKKMVKQHEESAKKMEALNEAVKSGLPNITLLKSNYDEYTRAVKSAGDGADATTIKTSLGWKEEKFILYQKINAQAELAKSLEKTADTDRQRLHQEKEGRKVLKDLGIKDEDQIRKIIAAGVLLPEVGFTALGKAVQSAAGNLDEAQANLRKIGLEMDGPIVEALVGGSGRFKKINLDAKEVGESFDALTKEMTAFRAGTLVMLPDTALANVGNFTAAMKKFKISHETTAKALEYFQKVEGMSIKQSMQYFTQIMAVGKQLGIGYPDAISRYIAAGDTLAIYGDKSLQIFADLELQSIRTGLSVKELADYAMKFDRYDEATKYVQQLNAAMGKMILDPAEMVGLTPEDRVRRVNDAFVERGVVYDNLNFRMKQLVASALGMETVPFARQFFRRPMDIPDLFVPKRVDVPDPVSPGKLQSEIVRSLKVSERQTRSLSDLGRKTNRLLIGLRQTAEIYNNMSAQVLKLLSKVELTAESQFVVLDVLLNLFGKIQKGLFSGPGAAAAVVGMDKLNAVLKELTTYDLKDLPTKMDKMFDALGKLKPGELMKLQRILEEIEKAFSEASARRVRDMSKSFASLTKSLTELNALGGATGVLGAGFTPKDLDTAAKVFDSAKEYAVALAAVPAPTVAAVTEAALKLTTGGAGAADAPATVTSYTTVVKISEREIAKIAYDGVVPRIVSRSPLVQIEPFETEIT
jgi:hypothetical protein